MIICGEDGEGDEEAVADEKSPLDFRFVSGDIGMIHIGGFRS